MFWANVLQGVLALFLIVAVLLVGNSRAVMGEHRLSRLTNLGLVVTAALMFVGSALLGYGLLTGQS